MALFGLIPDKVEKPVLHVVSNKQASFLNGEMIAGAGKGAIAGAVVGMPVVGAAIGTVVGGVSKLMEDNKSIQETGAVVETIKPPSRFNREALAGTVIGGGIVGTGALLLGGLTTGAGVLLAGFGGIPMAIGAAVVTLAVPAIGGMIGGSIGLNRMKKEYADGEIAVKQQAAQTELAKARVNAISNGVSFKNTAPLSDIEAGKNASPVQGGAVERILAARQQASQQPQMVGSPS